MNNAADLEKEVEAARDLLRRGFHNDVEGFSLVCTIFYYDMVKLMSTTHVQNHRAVWEILERIRLCAHISSEYNDLGEDGKARFGKLAATSMIGCIAQLIETSEFIYEFVGLDAQKRFKEIKSSRFWQFRNRYVHTMTHRGNRGSRDPRNYDINVLSPAGTTAEIIRYVSLLHNGWSRTPISIPVACREVSFEMRGVFKEILNHCAPKK